MSKTECSKQKTSFTEAQTLLEVSLFRGAINRAYYAMFYSVLCLATLEGRASSKHSGVIAFFDREFVKTKKFPREFSKSRHLAFQKRQENDYGELVSVSGEEASRAVENAGKFLAAIEAFLQSKSSSDNS